MAPQAHGPHECGSDLGDSIMPRARRLDEFFEAPVAAPAVGTGTRLRRGNPGSRTTMQRSDGALRRGKGRPPNH